MKKLQVPGCFFLYCWFLLVCVICSARSCLQCDLAVRHMHEDFIATQQMTVQEQLDLKKIISHAYITYHDTSMQLSGLVDLTTLYRAETEYQSEFKRHWQKPGTGAIQWDMIQILEKGKRILTQHLKDFVSKGLCPNRCGLLFQSVMNCSSCQYGPHICQSDIPPKDCGGYYLSAKEGEQAILDCFLPWHTLVVGTPEYHYFWKQGATNFIDDDEFETLVVTKESKIVLNQLSVREQGVYRCFLLDQHGITLSHIHFILTIFPLPVSPPRLIPTLPSLPGDDVKYFYLPKDILITKYILLTVLSILCSLAIIICNVKIVRQQKKEKEQDERKNMRWRKRDSSLPDI